VINADNGPENSGVRTQWLRRLAEFSVANKVTVQLACYPPYHSKYNPVERVFGVLENYWNGDPLLSIDHALGMAAEMKYKGVCPKTSLHPGGPKGVSLKGKAMKALERGLERMEGLKKWFVKFVPEKAEAALKKLTDLTQ
jgi:hypothetical protein